MVFYDYDYYTLVTTVRIYIFNHTSDTALPHKVVN